VPEVDPRLSSALSRLAQLLKRIDHPRAAEVQALSALLAAAPDQTLRRLDANDWWAGTGSLAAATMGDNPGLPEMIWQTEVREFRELMIEIGEILRARGAANPSIASWLRASPHADFAPQWRNPWTLKPPVHHHSAATTINWQSKRRNQVSEFAPVSESVITLFSKLMRNRPWGASTERSGNQVARSARR